MSAYHLEARHTYAHQEAMPDAATMAALWRLFLAIGKFWKSNPILKR